MSVDLRGSGAPEGTNLELPDAALLLENLEDWAVVLKSDREVIHKLEAFERAARGEPSAAVDFAQAVPDIDAVEDPAP